MLTDHGHLEHASKSEVDLSNCDREPIHVPGSIQPHGVLLVLADDDAAVLQVSENSDELLGVSPQAALGQSLNYVLGEEAVAAIRERLAQVPQRQRPVFLNTVSITADGALRAFNTIAHRTEGGTVLELELTSPQEVVPLAHPLVDSFSLRAEEAASIGELSRITAEEIRTLTGYDRVLVYSFDPDWHGIVVGEDGNGQLPSLLDHRFPASDIPAQARELYRSNRLRLIPDSGYRPVPLVPQANPVTGRPLDLSFATLRSVSPVHVAYMRNMETASSMSVSILCGGKLWGLVSCHHREPKRVPFTVRITCDLYARAFSLRLAALELSRDNLRRVEVRAAYSKLLAAMAEGADFAATLSEHGDELLELVHADGAAVLFAGQCRLIGRTPSEAEVRALADWMVQERHEEVYHTDSLSAVFPPAEAYREDAAGMLGIAVSKLHASGVFWFRPEVMQTIKWGGDPRKPAVVDGEGIRIQPRRSFETWKETVRGRSAPWRLSEIDGAHDLRNAVVGIVLRKAEELAELNAELTRSNKELESFSYSVSHDLRAPLRHIVGYAEMLKEEAGAALQAKGVRCINTIIESSEYAGALVDKLLAYSRMGRAELQISRVDMTKLMEETARDVSAARAGQTFRWQIGSLPVVAVDLIMVREAARNLLDNAAKYSQMRSESVIEVRCREEPTEYIFSVTDNGVGFDQKYADKLFGVFQRLHRIEDFQGTGIGLANVRRVMERHGGRTWAEGREDHGAKFYFTLPKPAADAK